jgi:hypothetical protein
MTVVHPQSGLEQPQRSARRNGWRIKAKASILNGDLGT